MKPDCTTKILIIKIGRLTRNVLTIAEFSVVALTGSVSGMQANASVGGAQTAAQLIECSAIFKALALHSEGRKPARLVGAYWSAQSSFYDAAISQNMQNDLLILEREFVEKWQVHLQGVAKQVDAGNWVEFCNSEGIKRGFF